MEADLKTRIEKVLSEIFTDKYGEEYGCKITLRFVPREDEVQEGEEWQRHLCGA